MLAKCKPAQPGSSGPALWGNGTNSGRRETSLKGASWVECRCAAIAHRRWYWAGWGTVSGDQAELPGPRHGLGPVGGAELAQDMGHVLFDRVERHHQLVGDALV